MGNNKSSVDTGNGEKLAAFAGQYKAQEKASFKPREQKSEEQIVNAKKAENVKAKKEKEKKRKRLAKASKKKNKK